MEKYVKLPICIGLFILGLNEGMKHFGSLFSWVHEFGHLAAAVMTGKGGEIISSNLMVVQGEVTNFISYAGSYGQVLILTLILLIFAIFGLRMYIPAFLYGGIIPCLYDPWILCDWEWSSTAARSGFVVFYLAMNALCLAAFIYMGLKWFAPKYYEELPVISRFKKAFKKQAGWI